MKRSQSSGVRFFLSFTKILIYQKILHSFLSAKLVSFSDLEFKTEKISALTAENEIKEETIAKQAREMSTMKITIAQMKSQIQDMNYRKDRELDLAREDAMGSMAALKDLPEELRIAHRR